MKVYRRDREGMSRARAYRDVLISAHVQEESEEAVPSVTVRRAH
jgi:hypothetical protein